MGYVFCMLKIEIAKNAGPASFLDGSFFPKALPHGQLGPQILSSLYGALGMLLPVPPS